MILAFIQLRTLGEGGGCLSLSMDDGIILAFTPFVGDGQVFGDLGEPREARDLQARTKNSSRRSLFTQAIYL